MIKGPDNLPYEERLKELGLFSLGEEKARGGHTTHLSTVFHYLKGGYKERTEALSSQGATYIETTGTSLRQERGFISIQDKLGFWCLVLGWVFLNNENNQPLEQPPQGCGRVPSAGGGAVLITLCSLRSIGDAACEARHQFHQAPQASKTYGYHPVPSECISHSSFFKIPLSPEAGTPPRYLREFAQTEQSMLPSSIIQ